MRYFPLLLTIFTLDVLPIQASVPVLDSLQSVLHKTTDPVKQISILRDLADLTFETQQSCHYLLQIAEKAHHLNQTNTEISALSEASVNYMVCEQLDSARFCMARIEEFAPEEHKARWMGYLHMRLFNAELLTSEASEALEAQIPKLKNRDLSQENIYDRIAIEYCLGQALVNKGQNQEAFEYLLRAYELTKQLNQEEQNSYLQFVLRRLSNVCSRVEQNEKSVALLKEGLTLKEHYYENNLKANRPFYPIEKEYCSFYSALMINVRLLLPQESQLYLTKLTDLARKTTEPTQKYNCFLAINNYHLAKHEWPLALSSNDSLIHYASKIARYNLPNLYHLNSRIHFHLGAHKDAYIELSTAYQLRDSIQNSDMQEQLNQMRVEHDVNRLNYEKSQLEIQNKQLMLIGVSLVLLLSTVLCLYLYITLKQSQKTRARMEKLKRQAEESEKLKTAFINSICHEIRTPLNAISGFSSLVFDYSFEAEERKSFATEIQENTTHLVNLIDSMLEVANLDVSDAQLPCKPVDLIHLCQTTWDRLSEQHKSSAIQGITKFPADDHAINTHPRYLAMVLYNLLDNAYKFTEQGKITFHCEYQKDAVKFSITDTGCGIPLQQQQHVFDRFVKLDIHKPGNGLGLYLCKIIISRLSGTIQIDPTYTQGTRVVVVVPCK